MRVSVSEGGTMERSVAEELERHVDDGLYAVPEVHEWSEGCDCAHDPEQGCCSKAECESRVRPETAPIRWCASCFAHRHWLENDTRPSGSRFFRTLAEGRGEGGEEQRERGRR